MGQHPSDISICRPGNAISSLRTLLFRSNKVNKDASTQCDMPPIQIANVTVPTVLSSSSQNVRRIFIRHSTPQSAKPINAVKSIPIRIPNPTFNNPISGSNVSSLPTDFNPKAPVKQITMPVIVSQSLLRNPQSDVVTSNLSSAKNPCDVSLNEMSNTTTKTLDDSTITKDTTDRLLPTILSSRVRSPTGSNEPSTSYIYLCIFRFTVILITYIG